ncbi:uncharacterized protein [Drosophila virilis]|uniref:Uncharacterized protein n=1 Tax=Drosophila virilis TaxID=7244 RepID=B4LMF6_DROVI|nr:uncharacterized protein LOC6625865 [Drosophila virilis]EDW62051.1 uncharacterized protein Dvir_GJ22383 [Drosophila virilis]
MSIVLDVVQRIVLSSAYELTCAAAAQVLNKCKIMNAITAKDYKVRETKDNIKSDAKNNIDIEVPDPPGGLDPSSKKLETRCLVSQLDEAYRNSGPICPPQTSSMRLARNSYFS